MKLAIITVNFRNQEETIACLRSLDKSNHRGLDLDYYVVDNESTEVSRKALSKSLPGITIISSPKNLGFAGGSNLAIRSAMRSKVDFVLLMNPDTLVESKDFLVNMVDEGADLVAPVIKYRKKGKLVYDLGGQVDYLFGRNTHIISDSQKSASNRPDYFTGACLLIKAEVFQKIGLLDEGFFLYFEDADFCLRAKKAGFTQKLCSKAVLFHHLSTTTSQLGRKKLIILAESHLRFCLKHLPVISSPFYLAFNLFLRLKSFFP